MSVGLTIGQLAAFAGTTARAVRHYHERGLLPEPDRDASGYRRYDATAVVELIRIRTLAEAGVPLTRVRELLQAEPAQFARAVADIDARLRRRVAEIEEQRRRVAGLTEGDGLVLPREVVAYLDRLRALGLSERSVALERDSWILVAARWPDLVVGLVAPKAAMLDDDEFVDLYRMFDDAFDRSPDDPRLVEIAEVIATYVRRVPPADPADRQTWEVDPDVVALLNQHTLDGSPAWRRLAQLLAARDVHGWAEVDAG